MSKKFNIILGILLIIVSVIFGVVLYNPNGCASSGIDCQSILESFLDYGSNLIMAFGVIFGIGLILREL